MDAQTSNGTLWVLGDAATVMGFRLAGLRGWIVESAADARAALDALRAERAALVVLTETLCDALGGPEALARGATLPVVAVIPSVAGPRTLVSPGTRIARVVQRALGIPAEGRA
jgi:vacuolar-type H+-ATPase subunit F/Vma7